MNDITVQQGIVGEFFGTGALIIRLRTAATARPSLPATVVARAMSELVHGLSVDLTALDERR